MSMYLQQEFDFVDRTKKILKQYDELKYDEKFEDTLMLNCLVGLLILPQQAWFDLVPNELLSREKWGIPPEQISYITKDEEKTVSNTARHLRNSISHYRFEVFGDSDNKIDSIKFIDFRDKKTFEAIIQVKSLRDFIEKFSSYMMNVMLQNKK